MKLTLAILLSFACAAQAQFSYHGRRMHPVSSVLLTTSVSTANTTEYATGAFVAGNYRLILAVVVTSDTVLPDAHALTSLHGTWTQIGNTNFFTVVTPLKRLSLWRLMTTSGTVSSTLTNKFSNAATGCGFVVMQFNGVDATGTDGSGAVVQFAANGDDVGVTLLVTLSAFTSPRNAGFGGFGSTDNPFGGTPETGWFEDADTGYNTPATGLYATHRNNTSDNTVTVSPATFPSWGGIAVEIKSQY